MLWNYNVLRKKIFLKQIVSWLNFIIKKMLEFKLKNQSDNLL